MFFLWWPCYAIKVQTVIGEGFGWKPFDTPCIHVILTDSPNTPLFITSNTPSKAFIERGADNFEWFNIKNATFITNAMGRVSFSIPVDTIDEYGFPTLFVQPPASNWTVVHLDYDARHKIASMSESDWLSISNHSLIPNLSKGIQDMIGWMNFTLKRSVENVYDHRLNYIKTHQVSNTSYLVRLSKRTFSNWVETEFGSLKRYSFQFLEKVCDLEIVASQQGSQYVAILRNYPGGVRRIILDTVDSIWQLVQHVLGLVKMTIGSLLSHIYSAFDFPSVWRTQRYLSSYFRLLAPLGFQGLDLANSQFSQWKRNRTVESFFEFNSTLSMFGAKDVTMDSLRDQMMQLKNSHIEKSKRFDSVFFGTRVSTNGTFSEPVITQLGKDPLDADALVHIVHDRIIHQLPNIQLSPNNNNDSLVRMVSILQGGAKQLLSIFDTIDVDFAHQHILKFDQDVPWQNRTVAHLLNWMRSLDILTEGVSFRILNAVSSLLPAYWNLATFLMFEPIQLPPFLYKWWTHSFSLDQSEFSMNDVLTFSGAMYASSVIRLYFDGEPPFTETDLMVLQNVKDPELILYTWNNDPRTFVPEDDTVTRLLRLGYYDWIPKCNWAVLSTWMSMSIDIPNILTTKSVRVQHPSTYPGQIFGSVAGIQGRVASYPFTQLKTNDPAALQKSKLHPSQDFLSWWYYGVIEDFIRFIRPWLGKEFNQYPRFHVTNLIVGTIPSLYYGWSANYRTASEIASDDYPRQFVMGLNWMQQIFSTFNAFAPFMPLSDATRFTIQIAKDINSFVIQHTRVHVMVAYRVVGMLSSSWQGGPPKIKK